MIGIQMEESPIPVGDVALTIFGPGAKEQLRVRDNGDFELYGEVVDNNPPLYRTLVGGSYYEFVKQHDEVTDFIIPGHQIPILRLTTKGPEAYGRPCTPDVAYAAFLDWVDFILSEELQ